MHAHPAAEGVQKYCRATLSWLAKSEEHRATIAAAGDIDVLTAAMHAHPEDEAEDEEVQEQCRAALGVLALSEEHRAAIGP
jgi:hypothetical protein